MPGVVPISTLVIAVLLSILLAGGGGAWTGWDSARNKDAAELNQYKDQVHEQQLRMEQQTRDDLAAAQQRAIAAESTVDAQRRQAEKTLQELRRRIDRDTTLYKPNPAAAPRPLPQCVFTRGFLRDYNTALGVQTPARAAGPGADAPAGSPASPDAELLDAGITPADILAHAGDYGHYCTGLSHQVTGLLDALGEP